MTLREAIGTIKPIDQAIRRQAKQHWDQVAKPLESLGVLEEDIIRIAAASGSLAVSLHPRAIVVMCGDNGVVKEGVTQTGQEVTAIVAGNMAQGNSCVCLMARQAGAAIVCVTRFIKSPLTAYADLTLLCGANESPLQAGSSSAEISQLFLIDMLYTEYYRTYYDRCSVNNEKTSASVMAKLC